MTDAEGPAVPDAEPPRGSYSTAEAAQRLGVSTPTVQRWVDAGHLRAWKTPGGHRRVDAADVERVWRQQRGPHAGEPARSAAGRTMRVVIVDDNADDRDLMGAAVNLVWPQARVDVYDNGFQALLAIGRQLPDALLTDVVMPHMDGPEMLRQLAASAGGLPRLTVVVSAERDDQGRPRVALPQGTQFLPKPLDGRVLVDVLRQARLTP